MACGQANLACYEETPYGIDDYCVFCEAVEIYAENVYTSRNAVDSRYIRQLLKISKPFYLIKCNVNGLSHYS